VMCYLVSKLKIINDILLNLQNLINKVWLE